MFDIGKPSQIFVGKATLRVGYGEVLGLALKFRLGLKLSKNQHRSLS
jgi:hypothetical protein